MSQSKQKNAAFYVILWQKILKNERANKHESMIKIAKCLAICPALPSVLPNSLPFA
jgi:hypothetical protein